MGPPPMVRSLPGPQLHEHCAHIRARRPAGKPRATVPTGLPTLSWTCSQDSASSHRHLRPP